MKKIIKKNIILGVTGSIAAYKSPDIVRLLRSLGAEIRVVMTHSAKKFITPLSLQTVSNNPVAENLFTQLTKKNIPHIELAQWANLILIAPASANILTNIAIGCANNLLENICLATTTKIAVAPAMNHQMYKSPAIQNNINILNERGVLIWGPKDGEQICSNNGYGRMLEPKELANLVYNYFKNKCSLEKINIMITAGPTKEHIDPVRFISNHSSGKMGFAIAKAAADKGAKVTLITGPVNLLTPPKIQRINITTALEMKNEVMLKIKNQKIFIGCAAVSDYRIQKPAAQKIKKNKNVIQITMIKNPDIIKQVGLLKENRPYVVGFIAETNNIKKNAKKKLISKNIDLICANDISKNNQGFYSDKNELHLFWKNGDKILRLNTKTIIAEKLINEIVKHYAKKNKYQNT